MYSLKSVYICICVVWMQVVIADEAVVIQVRKTDRSYTDTRSSPHNISIVGNNFMLDGVPLHIMSGSVHYFRLPAAYWRDRLRKLKAAGLNSVSTYVEWSYHEPEYRQYSFEGDKDLAAFIRTAAEEGLHVLLRPGPYICAERDLGGLPYWLLGKYPSIKLRTTDPDFIRESRIWLAKLFEQVEPLLFGNGGPIILVQVENEYGSYGNDMAYKDLMRDIIAQHTGTNALLYTTDGSSPSFFIDGHIPGTLTTIDFGPGFDVEKGYQVLRKFMREGPLMNSEYYPGWLTHWGESFQGASSKNVVGTLKAMLDLKINVNFYVFHGGTNFEFTSGANYGTAYQPDITSYDYDAPLSEAGDPTEKYYAIRNLLKQYNFVDDNISLPSPSPKGAYGPVTVKPKLNLLSTQGRSELGKKYNKVSGTILPTFEELSQRNGLILFETTLSKSNGTITVRTPHDWIYVYVDKKLQGSLNRMYKKYTLNVQNKANSVLSLLVESQGRINFGRKLTDRKGILSSVEFNGVPLRGDWTITGFPLETMSTTTQYGVESFDIGPVLFEGNFVIPKDQAPLDTFLDTTGWGRGYVWVNGYNLGRYWPSLGPQVTLYVPGVWLKAAPAPNTIQILELEQANSDRTMEFIGYPILNRTNEFRRW